MSNKKKQRNEPQVSAESPKAVEMALSIPGMPPEGDRLRGYQASAPINIQVRFGHKDPLAEASLNLLFRLNSAGVRLANGRYVSSHADVMRWLLEGARAAGV